MNLILCLYSTNIFPHFLLYFQLDAQVILIYLAERRCNSRWVNWNLIIIHSIWHTVIDRIGWSTYLVSDFLFDMWNKKAIETYFVLKSPNLKIFPECGPSQWASASLAQFRTNLLDTLNSSKPSHAPLSRASGTHPTLQDTCASSVCITGFFGWVLCGYRNPFACIMCVWHWIHAFLPSALCDPILMLLSC